MSDLLFDIFHLWMDIFIIILYSEMVVAVALMIYQIWQIRRNR